MGQSSKWNNPFKAGQLLKRNNPMKTGQRSKQNNPKNGTASKTKQLTKQNQY